MNTLAIDLGGTRVKLGLISDGKVVSVKVIPAYAQLSIEHTLLVVTEECRRLIKEARMDVTGVGVAFPSLVNHKESRVISPNEKYPDVMNFDFSRWAHDALHLPVIMENDANAAMLGEASYGCARDVDNAVLMILGTGVGTAAWMDGRLVRGKHFQAGCLFGHLPVRLHGHKCVGCPGAGCTEAEASTWALPLILPEIEGYESSGLSAVERPDFSALKQYVEKGDPCAIRAYSRCCDYWANALIGMIYAYDPELVVLSGGVSRWGDQLLSDLAERVWQHAWTPWGRVEFRRASDPEFSVLLGLHALFEERI